MRGSFIFTLCLLIAAACYDLRVQAWSDGTFSSRMSGVASDLSATARKGLSWIESIKEDYGPRAAETLETLRQTIPEKATEVLQSTVDKVTEINCAELLNKTKTFIDEHPYKAAAYVVEGVVFLYPGLASTPFLWGFGLTPRGPRAASAAATLMSNHGIVPARSVYAFLQSAAMGGYGSALVQG